jgi:hypothetical protein
VCRPSVGVCDPAETCDGLDGACPTDSRIPDGTSCDDGNPCTQGDTCSGGTCSGVAGPVQPPATSVSINLIASLDSSTGVSVDGTHTFSAPAAFTLPPFLTVTEGLSGMGNSVLSFHSATTCLDVSCAYRGASRVPRAVTQEDKILGRLYGLQSCSDGTQAGTALSVTSLLLHVESGDTGTPLVEVQLIRSTPDDQGISVPPPVDAGPPVPVEQLGDAAPLRTPLEHFWRPVNEPLPDPGEASPESNGVYVPEADPYLVPVAP